MRKQIFNIFERIRAVTFPPLNIGEKTNYAKESFIQAINAPGATVLVTTAGVGLTYLLATSRLEEEKKSLQAKNEHLGQELERTKQKLHQTEQKLNQTEQEYKDYKKTAEKFPEAHEKISKEKTQHQLDLIDCKREKSMLQYAIHHTSWFCRPSVPKEFLSQPVDQSNRHSLEQSQTEQERSSHP